MPYYILGIGDPQNGTHIALLSELASKARGGQPTTVSSDIGTSKYPRSLKQQPETQDPEPKVLIPETLNSKPQVLSYIEGRHLHEGLRGLGRAPGEQRKELGMSLQVLG